MGFRGRASKQRSRAASSGDRDNVRIMKGRKMKGMVTGVLMAVIAAGVPNFASAAHAQEGCGSRAEVLAHLNKNFKEVPIARGLTSAGTALELIVSESGSWTILETLPNGLTCFRAGGEAWEGIPEGERDVVPSNFTPA